MSQTRAVSRPFLTRANDVSCREWACRASRYVRAQIRRLLAHGMLFADDPRVVQAWIKGWDEQHYVRLRRWHDDGFRPDVVYDIGAHVGAWSVMCHSIFRPAQTFLFEPQRVFCRKASAGRARAVDWKVVPVALGDQTESGSFYVTENAAASSMLPPVGGAIAEACGTAKSGQEKVRVMRLDDLAVAEALPLPDLVKIDVQGYEGHVLAGGKTTLERAQRMVIEVSLCPIYQRQVLLPEVLQTLTGWGFTLVDIHETFRQWPGPLLQVDLWLKR